MPENFTLKPVIILFVVVILGVVFIGEIADNQVENTELSSVTNESITMTSTATTITNESINVTSLVGNTSNGSVTSVTFFGNATVSTHSSGVRLGREINFTKAGVIIVSGHNFSSSEGKYNITYVYTKDVTGNTAQDDVRSVAFFGNGTNSTHLSSITIGAHVNYTKAGVITVDSYPFDAGTYNISYTYEGDLYVVDTTTHPLLRLLALFFVLVLIAFGVQAIRNSSEDFSFGFKK